MAAKDAMFSQLMGRLKEELGKGDPAGAIAVCQVEAPRIAQQVAKDKGVKIGRTALKLRNPQNQPPAWAKDLIDRSVAEPTFLDNKHGEFAALLPIKLQAQCLLCHRLKRANSRKRKECSRPMLPKRPGHRLQGRRPARLVLDRGAGTELSSLNNSN